MDKNYNYKHTKGFIVLLLIFIIGMANVVWGQVVSGSPNTPSGYSIDSTTGNLIQNPTMTTNSGWTTTGMTGSYTPDGYIFSYASGTIYQDVNLGAINFGYQNTSAVFATGIMYGFKYRFQCANQIGGIKNLVEPGYDCTDLNGPQDTLHATFTYRSANGTVEQSSVYQLGLKNINDGNPPYNPVWQQLAETYTFAGVKPISTVGTARLSITGMDAGFWACNPDCYGPQIRDAYVRLNYSVDPCVLNPAYNPSCPGFQNILQGSKSPTFNYSYNIAQSLPHIGGGVVLHGYDYGFNWWNYGACYNTFMFWCTDWRSDGGGNINFRITDKNNTTMFQQQWYVAGNNSGGSYSNRHLFTESRNSLDMGSVQWWASDVWNHFGWVGWTKPIWTPDPCYTQPLYSPNCSNFDAEIKRLATEIKATQESQLNKTLSSTATTPSSTVTTTINNPDSTSPIVTVTTNMLSDSPSTTVSTAITPTIDMSARTARTESSSESLNFALNLIRQNQQREDSTAISASQRAIESANTAAVNSIKQAENIALEAASNSSQQSESQSLGVAVVATTARANNLELSTGPQSASLGIVNVITVNRSSAMNNTTQDTEQSQSTAQTNQSTVAIVKFNSMNVESADSSTNNSSSVATFNPVTIGQTTNKTDSNDNINAQVQNTAPASIAISPATSAQVQSTPIASVMISPVTSTQVQSTLISSENASTVSTVQGQIALVQPVIVNTAPTSTVNTIMYQSPSATTSTEQSTALSNTTVANVNQSQVNILPSPSVPPPSVQSTSSFTLATAPITVVDIPKPSSNFVGDRTDPINQIIEQPRPNLEIDQRTTAMSSVKQSAQDSEVAGGVSIATIARMPIGFEAYNVALRDVAFYAPKEIYRGQRNVDNVRALRSLATDRLHQEMVDQQYRR